MFRSAAMTPVATQEPLAEQRQAAEAAPVTVRTGQPEQVGRGSSVACGRHRDRRQQIIGWRRG
jgi:hypothetical protein